MTEDCVLKAIKGRRSIRQFKSQPIPEDFVKRLIEALIWAPSAGNLQSRKFYFVSNEKIKNQLVEAAWGQSFIAEAPLTIVTCADYDIMRYYGRRGAELYMLMDVAASIQNLMLEAHELGLGTVWVGAFQEEPVTKILNLPENLRPVSMVAVGYPAETPSPPSRVSPEKAIIWIR